MAFLKTYPAFGRGRLIVYLEEAGCFEEPHYDKLPRSWRKVDARSLEFDVNEVPVVGMSEAFCYRIQSSNCDRGRDTREHELLYRSQLNVFRLIKTISDAEIFDVLDQVEEPTIARPHILATLHVLAHQPSDFRPDVVLMFVHGHKATVRTMTAVWEDDKFGWYLDTLSIDTQVPWRQLAKRRVCVATVSSARLC